jgi:hypothetical protein
MPLAEIRRRIPANSYTGSEAFDRSPIDREVERVFE